MKLSNVTLAASILMMALSANAAQACSKGAIGMILKNIGMMTEKNRCEAEKRHREMGKPLDAMLEGFLFYSAGMVAGPLGAGAAAAAIESYKGAPAEKALGKALGYGIGGSIPKGFMEP